MLRLLLITLSLVGSISSFGQTDQERCIIAFFTGLSELDEQTLRDYTTEDFILLESGEVWNLDTLIRKVSHLKGKALKRDNKFSFIMSREEGNTAWLGYHNTAVFTMDGQQRTRNWLESAVLVKRSGKWKIQMLHSTMKE